MLKCIRVDRGPFSRRTRCRTPLSDSTVTSSYGASTSTQASFARSVVSDQCPTFFGKARVRFWLEADIHPHSDLRPLYPRKQTYRGPMSAPGAIADHLQSGDRRPLATRSGHGGYAAFPAVHLGRWGLRRRWPGRFFRWGPRLAGPGSFAIPAAW